MHSSNKNDFQTAAAQAGDGSIFEAELSILRDVFRLLPAGVTVQDEHGEFVLMNDAATALLGAAAAAPSASHLTDRRESCLELLRAGRPTVMEEAVAGGPAKQVFLTSHRPVQVAGRNLLISSSTDITEQKAFEDHLFRSAYYDELTGLPTRRVIEHRVNSLLKYDNGQGRFALAFLDVDNFKHINDYYGHAVGDVLLAEMAKRLGLDLRESDILSRISGDEFVLLLNPIQGDLEVEEFIQFILQRLKAPFFIDGSEIFASTSIGVSLYPEHGRSYEVLRQNADIAMYRVKNGSKGAAAFFDASMEREALARMKIEQSLRLAILEKRFCCAFQPKVDIRTQEITGVEALVRLRDDAGVIQAPGTFINLATELGLIDELTHLVLAEIVKSIDLINETFGPNASISINVAAKQACNPEFMRSFALALEATGYPEHGRSYEVLRQNADIAMYRVKNDGKGCAAFFDASMEREALARMKVEQALRLAILEKRFCCAFQAKVDIRSKDIKGIEALVRLRDDAGVIQAPGTFINLATELGLIDELTHLVLA
ncbi:MAG: diguanylate cyclase, partial [Tardiphaga sp.]